MKKRLKILLLALALLILPMSASALVPIQVYQGGTGASTLTGLIQGNGTLPFTVASPFQTNGIPNGSQTLLNLVAGTLVTLTDNGTGSVTLDITAGTDYTYTNDGVAWSMYAGKNITSLYNTASDSTVTGNYTNPLNFSGLARTILMGNNAGATVNFTTNGTSDVVYIGNNAGLNDTSPGYNTGVGNSALYYNTGGSNNAAFGYAAGSGTSAQIVYSTESSYFGATSGQNFNPTNYDSLGNTFLGASSGVMTNTASITGSIVIGAQAFATDNYQFVLGGSNSTFNTITDGYFGSGVYAYGAVGGIASDFTMHATGGDITGTDQNGASLHFAGGIATGAGVGGGFTWKTSDAGASGITPQTLTNKMQLSVLGALRLNKYGVGTFVASPAYGLGVDGSGNVIEYTPSTGTVTSVSGTANRITSTGGATPVIDIAATYVGQTSLTTLGTIATGVWQGTVITGQYGGTGVSNNGKTITIGGNFETSGANAVTLTSTGVTNVTLPTTGTLATLAGAESLTNKKLGSLTTNGFVKTSGSDGTLSVDTTTYLSSLTVGTTPLSSGTVGRILFEGASNVLQESGNLFWDNTNSFLGLGLAQSNPQSRFQSDFDGLFEVGAGFNNPWISVGLTQNLLLRSEAFDNAAWALSAGTITVTANTGTDPVNSVTCDRLNGTAVADNIGQTATNSATGNFTFSVWLKSNTGTPTVGLRINSSAETGTTKSVVLTTSWQRYTVTQNFVSVNTTKTVQIITDANTIFAWGAQLSASAIPYPYINTIGGAVSAAASKVQIRGSGGAEPFQMVAGGTITTAALTATGDLTRSGFLAGGNNAYHSTQFVIGVANTNLNTYRDVNGVASDLISRLLVTSSYTSANTQGVIIDPANTNGLVFSVANGTRHIMLSKIVQTGITSTAGSEIGDLSIFSKTSAGAAVSEVARFSVGRLYLGGGVAPTAVLHLAAGTATANTAPLKFTSGTLNTSAVAGQLEYNGNWYTTDVSALRMAQGGIIVDYFTDSTVGGAEADIRTYTTPANTFNTNGDKIMASYSGNFVTGGTELTQLKVYFGGTAIWDSTGLAPATGTTSWRVFVEVIRVSSTVVRYSVSLNTTGASGFVYETAGELTGLTLSNTNILKITGTSSGVGSGSGDIIGTMGYIRKDGAANL